MNWKLLFGLGCTLGVAACNQTGAGISVGNGGSQANLTRSVTVASGSRIRISFEASLNPDCSSIPGASARLAEAPAHGSVSIEQTKDFPTFRPNNPRAVCNTKRSDGTAVYYKSAPGFVGLDAFSYDWFTLNGLQVHFQYIVHVN